MEVTYELIAKANKGITPIKYKGNPYVTVDSRVDAFRQVYPRGLITTESIERTNDYVLMVAKVYDEDGGKLLATGMAYEFANKSWVNKTSMIENCETSAIGRALGFCGFGIEHGIASKEEVENAIEAQEALKDKEPTPIPPKTKEVNAARINAIMSEISACTTEAQLNVVSQKLTDEEKLNALIIDAGKDKRNQLREKKNGK